MAQKIQIKRSNTKTLPTSDGTPSGALQVSAGELAYTEVGGVKRLFIGNTAGSSYVEIGGDNKMNIVSGSVSGDVATLNASGQVVDSGITLASLGTAGFSAKEAVLAATTTTLPAVTASGSGAGKTLTANTNGVLSVDGVNTWIDVVNNSGSTNPTDSLNVRASRVLVQNQANAADNGIYVVTNKGSAGSPFVLTRAIDADTGRKLTAGSFVFATSGTVNANAGFILTNIDPITIDTTSLTFSSFTGASGITAGTGLSKTGNTLSIANGGVTATQIANSTITGTQIASSVALAGSPTTTTQALNDNSTKIATTAYVTNQISSSAASSTLPSSQIFVGNASNLATAVSMSGDVNISNTGATTIQANAVTAAKINSSAIGNGLAGGSGTIITVKQDAVGGPNLAKSVNVSANGVAVKVDGSTISSNINDQLYIPNGGVTATQIANNTITSAQISSTANIIGSQLSSTAGIVGGQLTNNTITATQIANNTITAGQIANNTITAGQIASNTITSTQISNTANITGSQLSALAGIVGGQLANNTITAGQIANNAITATQIANNTITTSQISNTANITGSQLSASAGIVGGQLANNTITATQIASNTITANQIANNTITANQIANNAITAGQIASNTITSTQISNSANITGSQLSATAGIVGGQLASNTITSAQISNTANITGSQLSSAAGIVGGQLANNTITNSNLAQAGAFTWKGNNTNATANGADNAAGALTETSSSVLTITGGNNALLNATTIQVKQSNASQSGYLSSADWNTFNSKAGVLGGTVIGNISTFSNTAGQITDTGYAFETGSLSGSTTKIPNSAVVLNAIQASQQGLSVKESCLVATTANLSVVGAGSGATRTLTATSNGSLAIDGISGSTFVDVQTDGGSPIPDIIGLLASRVLVKNQTNASDNGIYVVTDRGSSGSKFVLTRALDFNSAQDITNGAFTFVESGTVNAAAGFVCSTVPPITLETTPINFVQFSGAGSIVAGTGLSKTGNTLSIANGGVTSTQIASNTITSAQISNTANITGSQLSSAAGIVGGQLANNTITNSNLAQAGAFTWKGNNTNATANGADNAAGALTETSSSVLTITGGNNALLNATTIQVKQSNASQSGYLSSADWNTFNNKQAALSAGNGVTIASNTVSVNAQTVTSTTLAAVNVNATGVGVSIDGSSIVQTANVLSVGNIDCGTF